MRTLLTLVLAVIAVALFAAFVLSDAVIAHTTDTDTVVATAREADLRATAVEIADEVVRREIARIPDPAQRALIARELRQVTDAAITPAWFYGAVATGHAGLMQFLAHGRDDTAIDLGEQKAGLRAALLDLGRRAGPQPVRRGASRRRAAGGRNDNALDPDLYRREIDRALVQIPNQTSLTALILQTDEGWRLQREHDRARITRALAHLRSARAIALAALAVALILVVVVNATGYGRALRALGGVLLAAGLVYVIGSWSARVVARDEARRWIGGQRDELARHEPLAAIGADGAERMVVATVDSVTGPSSGYAVATALAGAGLLVLGAALARRRSRPAPAPRG